MKSKDLTAAMRAEPFRPFTLRLVDGRSIHVPSRDYIAHAPGGPIAFVMMEDVDAGGGSSK
jgi:hypothetical protein